MMQNKNRRAGKAAAFLALIAALGAFSAGCFRRPIYYSQPPVIVVHHYGGYGGYGYGGGPVVHVYHPGGYGGYGGRPIIVHHYHR